jgi:AcrR family transcriptional regulator
MALTHSQRRWHQNHERLYEATLREIERVGLQDVRIERICEETRLSRPTFYAHFSNKEGVVSEFLCRFVDDIARALEARTRGSSDLEAVVDALVSLCHDASLNAPERLRREVAAYLPRRGGDLFSTSPVYPILTRAIVHVSQRHEIRAVSDPRALARRIAVVIHGFFLAHPEEPDTAAREAREVLKLLLQGLRDGCARASHAGETLRGPIAATPRLHQNV